MSIKRGVVTEVTSTSARPISVTSTLPIALVLKSSLVPTGIYGFESPKKGLEYFKQYLFKKDIKQKVCLVHPKLGYKISKAPINYWC